MHLIRIRENPPVAKCASPIASRDFEMQTPDARAVTHAQHVANKTSGPFPTETMCAHETGLAVAFISVARDSSSSFCWPTRRRLLQQEVLSIF
jgi:hypothetical protein